MALLVAVIVFTVCVSAILHSNNLIEAVEPDESAREEWDSYNTDTSWNHPVNCRCYTCRN